ncbi:MAG: beta-lactamase family protein [Betaproteobacteria bacterium]|nr:MAG: beta-lactamase family protein [Betaproteobacteria bacterium]
MKPKSILSALCFLAIGAYASFATAQALPIAEPASLGLSAQRLNNISRIFDTHIKEGKLPGVVFMIARDGKLAYSDALGFRDPAKKKPMAKDAIFRIYSMTKPLVSVAAMMLVEDGVLQLTDPVSKFLPSLKNLQVSVADIDAQFAKTTYTMVPAQREMTVQDLLRHSAGLAYGEISNNVPVKEAYKKARLVRATKSFDIRDLTPAQQIAAFSNAPLAHQPGTVWEYSLASDLLGRVVEAASGQRLGDFLEQRLFVPLRMADTGFWVERKDLSRIAEPLATDAEGNKTPFLFDVSSVPANDSGGAGAVSTAADYLRFSQMLLNGGKLDGTRVMSRSTIALMTSDHLGDRIETALTPSELLLGTPGYTFGLGFAVREQQGIAGVPGSEGEFTWGGYAGTYFWIDPKERIVAVYMSQAPGPTRRYYRKLFRQLVYGAITD